MAAWITGLLILGLCLIHTDARCPPLFENYNHACYYFSQDTVSSASDAFTICYDLGGYLLNINSKLEHDYAVSKLSDQRAPDGYWIGGYYDGQVWVWKKQDSTSHVVSDVMNPEHGYFSWGPFQPDDHLFWPYPQHNVAIMIRYRQTPYKWYSENKNLVTPNGMSYICEADWKE